MTTLDAFCLALRDIGTTQTALAKRCSYSPSAPSQWKKRNSVPESVEMVLARESLAYAQAKCNACHTNRFVGPVIDETCDKSPLAVATRALELNGRMTPLLTTLSFAIADDAPQGCADSVVYEAFRMMTVLPLLVTVLAPLCKRHIDDTRAALVTELRERGLVRADA